MVAQNQTISTAKNAFEKVGAFLIRYGLVLVLGWIGAMKFTAYEAEGGFPALSGSGGFLLKDVVLLGAALFTLGDSLAADQ